MRFSIGQHSIYPYKVFFGCVYEVKNTQRSVYEFSVSIIDPIAVNIILFYVKHPIVGSKKKNLIILISRVH